MTLPNSYDFVPTGIFRHVQPSGIALIGPGSGRVR